METDFIYAFRGSAPTLFSNQQGFVRLRLASLSRNL
jgi:hypothetical protein